MVGQHSLVSFSISFNCKDKVGVVEMVACHLLLGRSWYNCKVMHDEQLNSYSFMFNTNRTFCYLRMK